MLLPKLIYFFLSAQIVSLSVPPQIYHSTACKVYKLCVAFEYFYVKLRLHPHSNAVFRCYKNDGIANKGLAINVTQVPFLSLFYTAFFHFFFGKSKSRFVRYAYIHKFSYKQR